MTSRIPFPTFTEELFYLQEGYDAVIGADEVGRGAFAGPVVAAAVILPEKFPHCDEIHDSKLLSANKREVLSEIIKEHSLAFAISEIQVPVINGIGIGNAAKMAFRQAVNTVCRKRDVKRPFLLIDGFTIPYIRLVKLPQQKAIIKGDRKSLSIAAASIIAKVHRDELMRKYHESFPNYSFHIHKGYGTKLHQEEIYIFGLSSLHRQSFNLSPYVK